jgi:hypothetical protein
MPLAPDTPETNIVDWRANAGLAVGVTIVLSRSVMDRWHTYRPFDKCFSVFVLLSVLMLPWEGIRMKKRTHNLEVWRVCLLLMLVYFLFRLPL